MPFSFLHPRRLPQWDVRTLRIVTFTALVAVFAVIAALTYLQIARTDRANQAVIRALSLRSDVQQIFLLAQGAETAQRGYLLTGQDNYLAPYDAAKQNLPALLQRLALAGSAIDQRLVSQLTSSVDQKMTELDRTIALNRAGRTKDAARIVSAGRGFGLMADIRRHEQRLGQAQEREAAGLRAARDTGLRYTFIAIAGLLITLTLFLAISMSATLTVLRERNHAAAGNGEIRSR